MCGSSDRHEDLPPRMLRVRARFAAGGLRVLRESAQSGAHHAAMAEAKAELPHVVPGTHSDAQGRRDRLPDPLAGVAVSRSEEHTSELQSLRHLVCRLLLEKKKK